MANQRMIATGSVLMNAVDLFPSLREMPLEKVIFMQSLLDRYGFAVVEAVISICIDEGLCEDCSARDRCARRPYDSSF